MDFSLDIFSLHQLKEFEMQFSCNQIFTYAKCIQRDFSMSRSLGQGRSGICALWNLVFISVTKRVKRRKKRESSKKKRKKLMNDKCGSFVVCCAVRHASMNLNEIISRVAKMSPKN